MVKLIYPKLSYQIVGLFYEIFNELGYGHKEKIYQKAFAELLDNNNLKYERELYFPIEFKGKVISCYYFDFLISNKIVVEIKVANDYYQKDINQLLSYLRYKGFRLGILVLFSPDGLKFKRLVN